LVAALVRAERPPPQLVWEHTTDIDGRGDSGSGVLLSGDLLISLGHGLAQREPGERTADKILILQAHEIATGAVQWSQRIEGSSARGFQVDEQRVYIATSNSAFSISRHNGFHGGFFRAFDLFTGDLVWEARYERPDAFVSTPQVRFFQLFRGQVYLGGFWTDQFGNRTAWIQARDGTTGTVQWELIEAPSGLPDSFGSIDRATVGGSRLIAAGSRGPHGQTEYFLTAFDRATGRRLWERGGTNPESVTFALAASGSRVVRTRNRHPFLTVEMIDATNGASLWEHPLESEGDVYSSPRVALGGPTAFVASEVRPDVGVGPKRAEVVALKRRGGNVRWQRELPLGGNGRFWNLALDRRALLVHTQVFDGVVSSEELQTFTLRSGMALWNLTSSDSFGMAFLHNGTLITSDAAKPAKAAATDVRVRLYD
jgi:outer membrane protein assembly factor BamB